jgi:CxxC motif-containing protein
LQATLVDDQLHTLTGARCDRGRTYVEQELVNPHRQIASSILADGGTFTLASVRLTRPIPRDRIFDVMAEIKKIRVKAPIRSGEIIPLEIADLSVALIVTRTVEHK